MMLVRIIEGSIAGMMVVVTHNIVALIIDIFIVTQTTTTTTTIIVIVIVIITITITTGVVMVTYRDT